MQNELFSQLQPRPDDPILGLNEVFQKDERPEKVNLTVGAYLTDAGVMPLLSTVEEATKRVLARREPHAYIPMSGLPAYNEGVRRLLFGSERAPLLSETAATVQTIGGTGALYLAALFAKNVLGVKLVVVSDPTWGNHIAIFKLAGLEVATYPYYNRTKGGLRFDGMRSALSSLPANTMVLIHACCHNPTGVDLPKEAWSEVVKIVKERNLVPLLDIAYQGLGDGLEEDGYAPRLFADEGVATLVTASSSKNFALYGQRAGALHVLTRSNEEKRTVESILKSLVRSTYSNPPKFAGSVVAEVLADPELEARWRLEVDEMRERMVLMRRLFAEAGERHGVDLSFVVGQKGMFTFTGFTKEMMQELRDKYAVYGVANGRICVAGLNHGNVEYAAEAFAKVLAGR
ncbi:MAG TPA: aspartate/tyrosine/aromatic aminotransferase [Candidatus Sutterella merdavium]|nr:aspartate/tyrosine/aromatic aminotransferase [Candidatus Sutterella merdavium]